MRQKKIPAIIINSFELTADNWGVRLSFGERHDGEDVPTYFVSVLTSREIVKQLSDNLKALLEKTEQKKP